MAHFARLAGLGTVVPARSLRQREAAIAVERITATAPGNLTELFSQSRIERRHFALPDAAITDLLDGTTLSKSPYVPSPGSDPDGPGTALRMKTFAAEAPRLALTAARAAMSDAHVEASRITHVVVVTCTGFAAPGIDIALIRELHLRPTVERVQVGFMGCHGAINGLRVVQGLVAARPDACVLMVAVELCSMHFAYRPTKEGMVANALFADGAAALVVVGGTAEETPRLLATGSYLFPNTTDAMSWTIGDHGFAMTLSAQLPKLISAGLRPWLQGWLDSVGVSLGDIAHWIVHPGGPKILDGVEQSLSLSSDALRDSRAVMADYGNMSSATVLFILDRLRGRSESGLSVMLGFGPGLVAEAALIQLRRSSTP